MPDEWFVSSLQTISPDFHTGRYTGLITSEQLQIVRDQGTDEDTIEQEYGVSFTAGVKGAIFGPCMAKASSAGRICEIPLDDHIWTETLWDLGNADMSAVWFIQRVGSKVLFIDYYQDNYKDWPFYVNVLQNKGYRYRTHHLPHDGRNTYIMMPHLRPDNILKACVKESGIGGTVKTHERPQDKKKLIEACKRRFTNYWFDSGRCHEGIRLVERFHKRYDPVRKVFTKEPVHDESSHCCDALMLECLTRPDTMYDYSSENTIPGIGHRDRRSKSVLARFERKIN